MSLLSENLLLHHAFDLLLLLLPLLPPLLTVACLWNVHFHAVVSHRNKVGRQGLLLCGYWHKLFPFWADPSCSRCQFVVSSFRFCLGWERSVVRITVKWFSNSSRKVDNVQWRATWSEKFCATMDVRRIGSVEKCNVIIWIAGEVHILSCTFT